MDTRKTIHHFAFLRRSWSDISVSSTAPTPYRGEKGPHTKP